MTPAEVWILLEDLRPKTICGLNEEDFESLEVRRAELEKQGIKVL